MTEKRVGRPPVRLTCPRCKGKRLSPHRYEHGFVHLDGAVTVVHGCQEPCSLCRGIGYLTTAAVNEIAEGK